MEVYCVFGQLLCRSCMWHAHKADPLHWIECWMSSHFQIAFMWEVGGYVLVRHQTPSPICQTLHFQEETLKLFQINKKEEEINLHWHGYICDIPPQYRAQRHYRL